MVARRRQGDALPMAVRTSISTQRAALQEPGTAALLGFSLLARMPATMEGLILTLAVRAYGGSFAFAGLLVGAWVVGGGVTQPLLGGLVDRHGRRVLTILAATRL